MSSKAGVVFFAVGVDLCKFLLLVEQKLLV